MKKALSLMLALCMLFALFGCGAPANEPAKTEQPANGATAKTEQPAKTEEKAKVIKVGMSMPLTGASATAGIPSVQGMTLAANDINSAGGVIINGEKYLIEIIAEDDQGVPAEAVSAAQKLLTKDKVDILIASVLSSCALAIMELAPDYPDVLFSTVGCTSDNFPKLIGENPERYVNFYKPEFNSADYSAAAVDAIANYVNTGDIPYANKSVALLLEDNDFGRSFVPGVEARLATELPGSTVVAAEFFEAGATDFYSVINKLKSLKPDVVICVTVAMSSGVAYIKQVQELGAEWTNVGVNYPMQAGFLDQAGSAAEGLLWIPFVADFENNQMLKDFRQRVLEVYPDAGVTITHCQGYDILNMIVEAIKAAGTTNAREGLAEAYGNSDYYGMYGHYKFKDDHTAMYGIDYIPAPAAQVQNGTFVCVFPETKATGTYIGKQ